MSTTVFLSSSQMRNNSSCSKVRFLLVERRERLVHQQHLGIGGEGARDRDALLHSARKLVGVAVSKGQQSGAVEIMADGFLDMRPRGPPRMRSP